MKLMPLITKERIIDHVMGQVQKYLPKKNKTTGFDFYGNNYSLSSSKLHKQFIWSHNFLEEKKIEDYKKKYRIKYMNTKNKIIENTKHIKNKLIKKEDKDIPSIMKIKTEMFFSTHKNQKFKLNKSSNKLHKRYHLFES